LLQLRDRRPRHIERLRQLLLCQMPGGPQFVRGISLRSASARRRASARASGDICARSSLNFVVFGIVSSSVSATTATIE
jgi:hypothetical protein